MYRKLCSLTPVYKITDIDTDIHFLSLIHFSKMNYSKLIQETRMQHVWINEEMILHLRVKSQPTLKKLFFLKEKTSNFKNRRKWESSPTIICEFWEISYLKHAWENREIERYDVFFPRFLTSSMFSFLFFLVGKNQKRKEETGGAAKTQAFITARHLLRLLLVGNMGRIKHR